MRAAADVTSKIKIMFKPFVRQFLGKRRSKVSDADYKITLCYGDTETDDT
jgi:hypothetical protein